MPKMMWLTHFIHLR